MLPLHNFVYYTEVFWERINKKKLTLSTHNEKFLLTKRPNESFFHLPEFLFPILAVEKLANEKCDTNNLCFECQFVFCFFFQYGQRLNSTVHENQKCH